MSALRLAITGVIGSGKSVVSRIFDAAGVPVYDCDSRAKALMENDTVIRQSLVRMFGEECYSPDGRLNRKWLAARIFVDKNEVQRVNELVHPRVKADFVSWASSLDTPLVVVESAVLFESGLRDVVDKVLLVWADASVCIPRVEKRSGFSRSQIADRMGNQTSQDDLLLLCDYAVHNDGNTAVLPQIMDIIDELR